MAFWREWADGVSVAVRVQPAARRAGLHGQVADVAGTRLKIAVTEPPEDGRANRAVCTTLAAALDVPAATVEIIQGAGSRQKTLLVTGNAAALAQKLAAL
jgi:uncharacterized protein (TIGR00251 family)